MINVAAISIFVIFSFGFYLTERGSAAELPAELPEKSKILDMHCHVAGIGAGDSGAFLSKKMRENWKYRVYLKAFGVSEKEILRQGDGLIVRRISKQLANSQQVGGAVLLALDGVIDEQGQIDRVRTESYIPNDFLATEVAKYDNLYFGASINPYRHDALTRLEQVKTDGALLIKWLPAIQHIDPADERLIPFYRKLVELDLPLLTHAGDEHAFTYADNTLGDPQKLHLPLQQGVKVIVAHAATSGKNEGEDNMQRLLPMFAQYPNLFADISALTQANKLRFLPKLLAAGIEPQRLLYGTDFPLIKTGIAAPLFSSLQVAPQKIVSLSRIDNPWDQDLQLKLAHGIPVEVFATAHNLLIK